MLKIKVLLHDRKKMNLYVKQIVNKTNEPKLKSFIEDIKILP